MKKSVAVLGLGKFGSSIARSLAKGGAEVLAVDKDEDLVRDIADKVTCAVCVDISDKEMMNNIGLEGMDAVGADDIVYPEEEMGARIANNLLGGSMTDLFDLSADTSIVKVPARKEWINKSLVDINFRGKYNVNVIAIEGEGGVAGAPDPTKPIKDEENLVLIGKKEDLVKLRK